MNINAIDTAISGADYEAIKAKLNDIKLLMPFLVALSAKERRSRFKMSSKRFDFVGKVVSACQIEPAIVPSWVKPDELGRDYELSNQLLGIENMLEGLLSDVRDTRMQLGSEALKSAVDVYIQTQQAKDRIPGIQATFETLRASYPGRGKNKKKNG